MYVNVFVIKSLFFFLERKGREKEWGRRCGEGGRKKKEGEKVRGKYIIVKVIFIFMAGSDFWDLFIWMILYVFG